jgi:hypothetical protein
MKQLTLLIPTFVICLPFVARPVTITDVTTATTVFKDNFESGTFSPSVGSWSVGSSVTVTNSITPPNPGPFEASYYAQLFRNSNTPNQGDLIAFPVSSQGTLGDLIRLEMMVYLPSATDTDSRGQFMLSNGDFNSARAWMRPDGLGNVIAVGPGFALTDTGLNYITDVWQRWELDYIIGSSTFDVSIDGLQAAGFSSPSSGAVSAANLFNGEDSPAGSFYLDSVVPEPSTALLGALGIVALLFHRTRNGRNA